LCGCGGFSLRRTASSLAKHYAKFWRGLFASLPHAASGIEKKFNHALK
jgi:hypothetical protein